MAIYLAELSPNAFVKCSLKESLNNSKKLWKKTPSGRRSPMTANIIL